MYLKGSKKSKSLALLLQKNQANCSRSFQPDPPVRHRRRPKTKPLLIGLSMGWFTGCMIAKIGRSLVLSLGGSVILLEIANQKGYIEINWDKIKSEVEKLTTKLEMEVQFHERNLLNSIYTISKKNYSLIVGLLGGFLIGLAYH